MEIQGNVFLITGGASGLGAATARLVAEHGGKVVLADMNEAAGVALAKELGGVFVKCDVSQEADGKQRFSPRSRPDIAQSFNGTQILRVRLDAATARVI